MYTQPTKLYHCIPQYHIHIFFKKCFFHSFFLLKNSNIHINSYTVQNCSYIFVDCLFATYMCIIFTVVQMCTQLCCKERERCTKAAAGYFIIMQLYATYVSLQLWAIHTPTPYTSDFWYHIVHATFFWEALILYAWYVIYLFYVWFFIHLLRTQEKMCFKTNNIVGKVWYILTCGV